MTTKEALIAVKNILRDPKRKHWVLCGSVGMMIQTQGDSRHHDLDFLIPEDKFLGYLRETNDCLFQKYRKSDLKAVSGYPYTAFKVSVCGHENQDVCLFVVGAEIKVVDVGGTPTQSLEQIVSLRKETKSNLKGVRPVTDIIRSPEVSTKDGAFAW